ncbi:hypothetical protein QQS21_011823 [Conoideocrella luteorostrata]|uniref:FHA domain-containing protein n=1 Tax=Conoideocrella luteorostrata TaxID=1105319 RepID=A0AAJ0FVG6_9HYPO|nr:hypothetical protein QQS21_011823 [Conoideocrella luteorostrata]
MWLLESKDTFDGRRMWLRPGKTYLFGRTASEPGQLAISHSTISRKHLTITVESVEDGRAHHLTSRSKITVEDLATKIGTTVNGQKIRGSKYAANGEDLEVTMGKCPSKFRITWLPVVFTFSFTNKELQADPLTKLRQQFEQLDIKLLTDYNTEHTTHVISRKRNTAKGLQALINGKYVVTETFLDTILQGTAAAKQSEASALEQDFGQYWPDALEHLPPRGGEPVQHPDSIYTPDPDRKDVFDGYTFIFYDKTQYSNLMAPITNGVGKAMLQVITPNETQVDDFVRYVKDVAGEKGLESFDDGSQGKGVVLVRYLPAKGDHINWYADFITAVSLRLDHRPIEQNEFLEAILIKDASILRRALQAESTGGSQVPARARRSSAESFESEQREQREQREPQVEELPHTRRNRVRRPFKRRFAGFDDEADVDMDEPPPPSKTQDSAPNRMQEDEGGLFVSQAPDEPASQPISDTHDSSSRKRRASIEDSLMDGMAPAAARFKRQRLESGVEFASPSPEPEQPTEATTKIKKEKMDVLAMAARHREEEEARARAEREDLANLPDDIDLAEIRRLNIVEEIEVRLPNREGGTRDQDAAASRWDPRWNGIKNFKKFRRRGAVIGRQPIRTIVPLQEAKAKEYGIGDKYWLEDEGTDRNKSTASHQSGQNTQDSLTSTGEVSVRKRATQVVVSESEEEDVHSGRRIGPTGTSSTKITATPSQINSTALSSRQSKRPLPSDTPSGTKPKRPRTALRAIEVLDSDESEDELKFKFGKRR